MPIIRRSATAPAYAVAPEAPGEEKFALAPSPPTGATAPLPKEEKPRKSARVNQVEPSEQVKRKGIFDEMIAQIASDPHYLTADNIMKLRAVLPMEEAAAAISPNQQIDMSGLLATLTKLHQRMQLSGFTSNDPGEIGKMIKSTREVIELVRKHEEAISQQARQLALENAVVQSFKELGNPELQKKFLAILHKNLAK